MEKKFFLSILLVFGLLFPLLTYAQKGDFLLSEKDTIAILKAIQGEVSRVGSTIEIFDYSAAEQAALTLLRSSSRETIVKFLPGFVTTETVKIVLKLASSLEKFSELTIKAVLGEIEKQTVKKAVELGTDWLFQNDIRIGSGNIKHTKTGANFQYLITYNSIEDGKADIIFEFYSADSVTPAPFTGSLGTFMGSLGDTAPTGAIDPFIIHVDVKIRRNTLGWVVDRSSPSKISVEFPEKVPRLELTKELPYPIEEQRINFLNNLTSIKKVFDALGNSGIELFNILGRGVGVVKDIAEEFFSFISKIISLGGAGLVDPAVESQLNEIKEELDAQKNQAQLSLTKDESDEVVVPSQLELSETKEDLKLQEDQEGEEKLSLVKEICVIDPLESPVFGGIILSEIAWMGTAASANDEWIRLQNVSHLQNISNVSVNLQGWQLIDKDGDIEVIFEQDHLISSRGTFLLERTDDTSLPSVSADFIYTGALNNTNEALYLFDSNCVLRDKVEASPNWLGGDNDIKQPMVRLSDLSWEQKKLDLVKDEKVFAGCLDGQININAVNNDLLQEIVQIGEVRAEQIIEARVLQAFYTIDELKRISGIAGRTVAKIKEQGRACAADAQDVSFRSFQKQVSYRGGGGGSSSSQSSEENQSEEVQLCSQANLGSPNHAPLIINEVAWMGTTNSANDEWIELKNISGEEITLGGWQLLDASYQIKVIFTNQDTIAASGFYILERTDDTTLLGITADTIYVGSLGNTDESLRLFDSTCTLIDEIIADPDWPGGDNDTKKTLERKSDLGWQTHYGESSSGTPKSENSVWPIEPVSLPKTIVINEIAWMGTAASANDEWIELYNTTFAEIDLSGWKLQSEDGTPSIELVGTVVANSYFLLERTDDTTISDITADLIYVGALNNTGEVLKLYDAENNLIDIVDASAGWGEFGGDNTVKQSMERIDSAEAGSDPANWANNNLITHNGRDENGDYINGTPGQENSVSRVNTSLNTSTGLRLTEFDSIALTKLGSPYSAVWLTVPAGKTLIVEPGVRVEFENNRGSLTIEGTLIAIGESGNEIIFTSDGIGPWCALKFTSTSVGSELDYTIIEDSSSGGAGCGGNQYSMRVEGSDVILKNSTIISGNNDKKLYLENSNSFIDNVTISGAIANSSSSAIYVKNGSPTIQNSTITNNSIGIFVQGINSNPVIQNNNFTGNTYPIKLNSASAQLSLNTATDNTHNGTFIEGAVFVDTTWQADTMPYILNQFTVNEGKKLTIEAGAQVQFISVPYGGPELVVKGTLLIQGANEDNLVTFTKDPSISHWKRIHFTSTSTGSILSYAQFNYGGSALGKIGALYIEGNVDLQNVTIQNSPYVGILFDGGSMTGSNISLVDNAYAFHIVAECPTLASVTMLSIEADFHPNSLECSFLP